MKPKTKVSIGQRFGDLVILGQSVLSEQREGSHTYWVAECDCGSFSRPRNDHLLSGKSATCGCRSWRKKPRGWAALNGVYNKYKQNAKRRSIEFDIEKDAFRTLTSKPCHYCGTPPSANWHRADYNGDYIFNGLDRIDSDKGYILKNVVPCCKNCNFAKSKMTVKEFTEWLDRAYHYYIGRKDET